MQDGMCSLTGAAHNGPKKLMLSAKKIILKILVQKTYQLVLTESTRLKNTAFTLP